MHAAERRRRVVEGLEAARLDALLVGSAANVGYLTGFSGEDASLIVGPGLAILVSDGRYEVQIAEECPDVESSIRPIGQPLTEAVGTLAKAIGLRRLGFEAHATTVDEHKALAEAAEGVELVPTRGRVEGLRTIKDATEIAAIRESVAVAEWAFLDLRAWLRPGVSEKDATDFLESALRSRGATAASFPPIVAAGRRAALPHARPSQGVTIERDSLVLIDWGASGRPYKSDLTRMLTTGKVTPEFATAYRVVLEAQRRAIGAIRPGVEARAVDLAARSLLDEAGLGPFFKHSVGHGIGRDVHEAPVLRHLTETLLAPGMVVTVEPGVYVPEWGGVRIEDDVLVTESGSEVLSTLPKSLGSLGL